MVIHKDDWLIFLAGNTAKGKLHRLTKITVSEP